MTRLIRDLCPDSSHDGARGTRTPDLLGAIQRVLEASLACAQGILAQTTVDGDPPNVRSLRELRGVSSREQARVMKLAARVHAPVERVPQAA
jgi:hypothetical protein